MPVQGVKKGERGNTEMGRGGERAGRRRQGRAGKAECGENVGSNVVSCVEAGRSLLLRRIKHARNKV